MDKLIKKISFTVAVGVGFVFAAGSTSAVAGDMGPVTKQRACRPFLMLTTGEAFSSNAAKAQSFPATEDIFTFYDYSRWETGFSRSLFGGSLGAECLLRSPWALQLGVGYYQPAAFTANGAVTQGVDVSSEDTYQYRYQVSSQQVLGESKLLYQWGRINPYIAVGLGASFNKANDFTVDIEPPFTTFSNQFGSGSTTSFSYSVGAGIDFDVIKHLRVGVGYRFADFGTATTGSALIDDVQTTYKLHSSHLYANEVFAQFSLLLM